MKTIVLAIALVLAMSTAMFAQSKLAGRSLAEVLTELESRGLHIVFSSELVRPEMRVPMEPRAQNPRRILDEVLRPHGLAAKEGVKGTLTIVRARAPRRAGSETSGAVGLLRGRLIEARTGEALAAGLVQVESTAQQSVSDRDGRFEITAVPSGPQRLLISMVGYALVRREVDVPASGSLSLEIPLAEGAGTYVEAITVTAPAFRDVESGVASQSVLGSRDLLALRGAVADDPVRAVQALPEVMAADDYKAEFAVRGQGMQHLAFSLDGIDSRLLFHTVRGVEDTGSLALVNSDILESASIIAGARPQRLQARLGAAVDFTTRDGAADRLRVRGLVSATAASTVWEGPVGPSASWLVAARQSYLDWVLRKVDPESSGTFGFTDLQAKLSWTPAPRHSVQAIVVGGRSLLHESDGGVNSLDTGANHTAGASVRWRLAASDRLVVSQQVYAVNAGYTNRTPAGSVRQRGSDHDLVWRGGVDWVHARGRVEGGGQAQHIEAARRSTQFTAVGPITSLDSSGRTTNGAAWLHTSWTLAPRLVVSPGARVDRWGMLDATSVSPWLLAQWQLTPGWRWRGGVSSSHQSPLVEQAETTRDLAVLAPERASGWDLGVERTFDADWRMSVNVYGRREHDLLRLIGGEPMVVQGAIVRPTMTVTAAGRIVQPPYWENRMTGHASGAGIAVERRRTNGLSGWLAYSRDRMTLRDEIRGETFPGDFDQRHTFNAFGIYRWSERTALSARWRIGSNFPIPGYYREVSDGVVLSDARNQVRLPLYSRLDVRADRAFTFRGSRLTLFVEVLNLTNRSNLGPADPDINAVNGRVRGLFEDLFPLLPSAGVILEF
jgi:hypothetical protein